MNSYHQGPYKHPEKTDTHTPHKDLGNPQLARLSVAALGVVFGDIGTSPLYALRECFHGEYGIAVTQGNVFGILSLLFWALVIIVTLKYLTFILRADNHGEGGVLALTALLKSKDTKKNARNKRGQWGLVLIGLFAACLLYGDGMITPAISVLSAVEGVRIIAGILSGLFFLVDFSFFCANLTKIFHGAWFPLVIGAIIFTLMLTWKQGRAILADQIKRLTPTFGEFKKTLEKNPPQKIRGQAIFLSGNRSVVPAALVHNLTHNKILHSEIVFLHFKTEDIPRIPSLDKIEVEKLGGGFYRIDARYGFMEEPKYGTILTLLHEKGLEFKIENASLFLGRERLATRPPRLMPCDAGRVAGRVVSRYEQGEKGRGITNARGQVVA